jgi:hypothetical protein
VSTPDELRAASASSSVTASQSGATATSRCRSPARGRLSAARPTTQRLEKQIELAGDKQLAALGFEVVKFSHPGKTKQTPGIADRRYYHRARRICFWWEAKSATGRQRPDQRLFQEMCDAVGDPYCLGTDRDLFTWLLARYPLVRDEQGHLSA